MEISNDPMFIVLNKLDDEDLVNYCQVNKQTFKICNNQIFWYNRIREKFSYIPSEVLNKTKQLNYDLWSDYYIKGLRKPNLNNDLDELLLKSSKNGRLDLVMMALNKGADVSFRNNTALIIASNYGYLNIVKFLVEKGADISAQSDRALLEASIDGHLEVVKFLIKGRENIQTDYLLIYASQYGHLDIVKFFVENFSHVPDVLTAAVGRAANSKEEYLDVIKYLVEKGANITTKTLVKASGNGHLNVVKYFVEKGVNIHARNDRALMIAAVNGRLNVVKYFVEKGDHIHARKSEALRISRERGYSAVVEYLESLL